MIGFFTQICIAGLFYENWRRFLQKIQKNDSFSQCIMYCGLISRKHRGFPVKTEKRFVSHLNPDCGLISENSRGFSAKQPRRTEEALRALLLGRDVCSCSVCVWHWVTRAHMSSSEGPLPGGFPSSSYFPLVFCYFLFVNSLC